MKNFKRVLSLALAALMVIGGLVVAPVDAKAETTYKRATEIKDGGQYVFVAQNAKEESKNFGKYYALGTEKVAEKTERLFCVEVTATETTLEEKAAKIPVWTIVKSGEGFKMRNGDQYVTSSNGNKAALGAEADALVWTTVELENNLFAFDTVVNGTKDCMMSTNINYDNGEWDVMQWAAYNDNDPNRKNMGMDKDFMLFEVVEEETTDPSESESETTDPSESESESTTPSESESESTTPSESETTKPEEKYTELTKELLAQFAAADATKETLFEGKYQATGTVTEVDASGFEQWGNIEFTLKIDGVGEILCWRVTVDKEDAIKVGDVLTVKGEIKNYKGLVEFVKPTFEKGKVDAKGDMTTAGIVMILFAGIALVSVAAYSKKRMAR